MVGCGLVMVKEKLKRLKQDLKIWNKEFFGDTNKEKQRLIENISELDKLDDQSGLNEEQKNQRSTLFAELKKVNNRFESMLRQKSRIKWLEAGDLNTKFFHQTMNWRKRKNMITGLRILGEWSENPQEVKEGVKEYFEGKLRETSEFNVKLGNVDFNSISKEDNIMLTKSFSEGEIKRAVWECEGNKSSGPNGFNFSFIKNSWEIIKRDIIKVVHNFQITGKYPKGCNASFIAPIPKRDNPQGQDEYRPISLVGSL